MENINQPLSDQIALVTGGSRGIGKQIAIDLAQLGAYVAINYNNSKESAEKVKEEILSHDGKAEIYQCDVGNNSDVTVMISAILLAAVVSTLSAFANASLILKFP